MKNVELREKQKKEALFRMRLLGFDEDLISMFHKHDMIVESIDLGDEKKVISTTISLKHKKLVEEIEEKYGILVYHVIHLKEFLVDGGTDLGECLNMFYVCSHESDWKLDRQSAIDKRPFIYHLNMKDNDYSEYGMIGITMVNNRFVKRLW